VSLSSGAESTGGGPRFEGSSSVQFSWVGRDYPGTAAMKSDIRVRSFSRSQRHRPLFTLKDLMWCLYLYPLRLVARILPPRSFVKLGSLAFPFFSVLTGKQRKDVKQGMDNLFSSLREDRNADVFAGRYLRNAFIRSLEDLVLDRLVSRKQLKCREFRGRLTANCHSGW